MDEKYLQQFYEERFRSETMPTYRLLTRKQKGIIASSTSYVAFSLAQEMIKMSEVFTLNFKNGGSLTIPKKSDTRSLSDQYPMWRCENCGSSDIINSKHSVREGIIEYSKCRDCGFKRDVIIKE